MITNILATLIITITTNTYLPKQFNCGYWTLTYPQTYIERWCDTPGNYTGIIIDDENRIRDNPDVKITEVREIKTLSFVFENKEYNIEVSNIILSEKKHNRIVTIEEKWIEEP